MSPFLIKLRDSLEAHQIRASRVMVAVSGGADSIALLRGLLHFRQEYELSIVVGHLNHQLRGNASHDDAKWLTKLCDSLATDLIQEAQDVAAIAAVQGIGIEEAGRIARYAFLGETAEKLKCKFVAVAHNANDQAETILHHIIRGTGLSGLQGMTSMRPLSDTSSLIRPILNVTRAEIEAFLREIDQDFRSDSSNADAAFTRNRIRNSLIPLLEADFNPQVRDAILKLGQQATDAHETLSIIANKLLGQSIQDASDEVVRLDCAVLLEYPRHLIRTCFLELWKQCDWPRQKMSFADWNRLAHLVSSDGTIVLPGSIEARRRGNLLVLRANPN